MPSWIFLFAVSLVLAAQPNVIWREPPRVTPEQFAAGAGGAEKRPVPPFTLVKSDPSGTSPKLRVTDGSGRQWILKFGPEANGDAFAGRVAWAAGYYVPATYLLSGHLENAKHLGKASSFVKNGDFQQGRFSLIDADVKLLPGQGWSWDKNPFLATPDGQRQLNGLKIVMMLTSNWDAKDKRDEPEGGNTGVFQQPDGTLQYSFLDWGATMGKWGGIASRQKWDCAGYAMESPRFITGVKDSDVTWGFTGKHTSDINKGITPADVQWLMPYLDRLTDEHLQAGLAASGATAAETACFTAALRSRLGQLHEVAIRTGVLTAQ